MGYNHKGYFWYSEKMEELLDREFEMGLEDCHWKNFCQLDSGEIVRYTVWTDKKNGSGTKWDDIKFLGHGVYHHSDRGI
jgi:hypothetical protein